MKKKIIVLIAVLALIALFSLPTLAMAAPSKAAADGSQNGCSMMSMFGNAGAGMGTNCTGTCDQQGMCEQGQCQVQDQCRGQGQDNCSMMS